MRAFLLVAAIAALASLTPASAQKYEDVHIWVSKDPAKEGDRRDGVLNFVADTQILVTVINAEDEVAQAIPYASITKIEYNPDAGHKILIYYKGSGGAGRIARLNLHGGNRERIVKSFEQAGLSLVHSSR